MRLDFTDMTNQQFTEAVDSWVKDRRARQMLKDRFVDGLTFDELSVKHNVSPRQAKRIVYKYGDWLLYKLSK